ncbi:MAG: NAD-dependent epimerase/dehydratase family protein [Cryomorphaceae bacterium]|nr:NAD-dependent epimerase/dehydratase family protein [Cryomorphaceae bacterium]
MERIAVTGATGLLGAHFLWYAVQAYKGVVGICRDPKKTAQVREVFRHYDSERSDALFEQIVWRTADLCTHLEVEDAISGVDIVFHLAARVSFDAREKKSLIAYNELLAETVVNACLYHKIPRLVHLSSVAALGRKTDHADAIDESTHWENSKQNSVYALSKYRAEMEAWRGMEEGLEVLVICPPIILGPGFWKQSSGKLYPTVAKGLPFYTHGENGFVDVRDLSKAMIQLVQAGKWNEKFIVSGVHLSYRELFNAMAKKAGAKLPYIHLNPFLGNILWRLESIRSRISGAQPLISKETFRSSQGKYRYISDKLIRTIDFSFTPIESTISWIGDWYKNA